MGNEDSIGHGSSGRGGWSGGSGDESRSLEAKVSGKAGDASSILSSDLACTGRGVVLKGFALLGFEEKGFAEAAGLAVWTPKSEAPIAGGGFWSSLISLMTFATGLLLAPLAMRTPRMPLTLPSFRRHVLCRQLQRYNRRSWPGSWSGRSPWSSSRRLSRPLQTLHLARAPEGRVCSSIHVWGAHQFPSIPPERRRCIPARLQDERWHPPLLL